jgi:heat shock protein HtpX
MQKRSIFQHLRIYFVITIISVIFSSLLILVLRHFGLNANGTGIIIVTYLLLEVLLFWFSDKIILAVTRVKPLSENQVPELYGIVRELSGRMNIPMPKIYLEESESLNAFATGRNPNRGAIAFTRGLIETLSPEETRFVVAHELSHIKNRDTRTMAAVSVLVGSIQLISELLWRSSVMNKVREKDNTGYSNFVYLALLTVAPIIAMFIQLAISRKRELKADSTAVEFTGDRSNAVTGLKKLNLYHFDKPQLNRATASLYISNPLNSESLLDRLFSTHPPIPKRIENIERLI